MSYSGLCLGGPLRNMRTTREHRTFRVVTAERKPLGEVQVGPMSGNEPIQLREGWYSWHDDGTHSGPIWAWSGEFYD